MNNKHQLLGVPKHANQHRLSRLNMEVHSDELRIVASEVESYTDELIAALEAAEKRIAELESDNAYIKNRHKELDLLIGKNILVMQAAIIEWQGTGDAKRVWLGFITRCLVLANCRTNRRKTPRLILTVNMLLSTKNS